MLKSNMDVADSIQQRRFDRQGKLAFSNKQGRLLLKMFRQAV